MSKSSTSKKDIDKKDGGNGNDTSDEDNVVEDNSDPGENIQLKRIRRTFKDL